MQLQKVRTFKNSINQSFSLIPKTTCGSNSCNCGSSKKDCQKECQKNCNNCTPISFIGDYQDTDFGCHVPTPEELEQALGTSLATAGYEPFAPSYTDSTIQSGCGTAVTRTFSASDKCCKTFSISRTAKWVTDNSAPIITCPANQTIGCDEIPKFGVPEVNDNCSVPTLTYVDSSNPAEFSHMRTWTATDACGNTSTCSQTITNDCGNRSRSCNVQFWSTHTELWSEITDPIVQNMPSNLRFTTSTLFYPYFSQTPGTIIGLPNDPNFTMLQALNLVGVSCVNLASQGVAALLNSAAFGTNYPYPSYITPPTFFVLGSAIGNGFFTFCSPLDTDLEYANSVAGTCDLLN